MGKWNMDAKEAVIELFETDFMRETVRGLYDGLSPKDIADLVKGSRESIWRKRDIYAALGEEDEFYAAYREAFDYAIAHMEPCACDKGTVSYMTLFCRSDEDPGIESHKTSLYSTFKDAVEGIRDWNCEEDECYWEYRHFYPEDDDIDPWLEQMWVKVTKYVIGDDGKTREPITYWCDFWGTPRYFVLGEDFRTESLIVSLFKPEEGDSRAYFDYYAFSGNPKLIPHIDIPLEPGAIVRLGAMPYTKDRPAVVVKKGKCGYLSLLCSDKDGFVYESSIWDVHSDLSCWISPIYTLDLVTKGSALKTPWGRIAELCAKYDDAYFKLKQHMDVPGELEVGPCALRFLMERAFGDTGEAINRRWELDELSLLERWPTQEAFSRIFTDNGPRYNARGCYYWTCHVECKADLGDDALGEESPAFKSFGACIEWLEIALLNCDFQDAVSSYVFTKREFEKDECNTKVRFTSTFEPMELLYSTERFFQITHGAKCRHNRP